MNQPVLTESRARETLELLWTRVRQRGDLPGFSKAVEAILGAMRGDDQREFNMTKTVLADPSLTQKVLRLANSPMYAVFGSQINTVSKAVIVLGTEAIGHLALGLKLIDGLAAVSTGSTAARDEMEKSVLASHVARQVASTAHARDTEEAVVCSMLHGLGRMMTAFYLPEGWERMQAAMARGTGEADAAQAELGLGLDDVGKAVARRWGFPATLTESLDDVRPRHLEEPLDHAQWLAALATMSTECAEQIHKTGGDDKAALARTAMGYADMLGVEAADIINAVQRAKEVAREEGAYVPAPASDDAPLAAALGKPEDAGERLRRGVAEMREAAGNVEAAQMTTMALETLFKGLGFSRSAAFLRSRERNMYLANMALGEGMQELMARLAFSDAYQPDVFHAALANDKMIFIENTRAPAFASKLPRWWREALPSARSFVLLPLVHQRQAYGFLYGDWDDSTSHARIENSEITSLNELRSLVIQTLARR